VLRGDQVDWFQQSLPKVQDSQIGGYRLCGCVQTLVLTAAVTSSPHRVTRREGRRESAAICLLGLHTQNSSGAGAILRLWKLDGRLSM